MILFRPHSTRPEAYHCLTATFQTTKALQDGTTQHRHRLDLPPNRSRGTPVLLTYGTSNPAPTHDPRTHREGAKHSAALPRAPCRPRSAPSPKQASPRLPALNLGLSPHPALSPPWGSPKPVPAALTPAVEAARVVVIERRELAAEHGATNSAGPRRSPRSGRAAGPHRKYRLCTAYLVSYWFPSAERKAMRPIGERRKQL